MIGAVATAAAAALLAIASIRVAESSADGVLVRHSDGAASAARDLLEYVPRVRRDVEGQLGLALPREFVVDLALDRAELESRDGAGIEPWAAGVAFPREGRIAIRLDAVAPRAAASLREVFRHEAAHLAFGALPARVPRWFEEGVAQWFGGRLVLGDPDRVAIDYKLGLAHRFSALEESFPSDELAAGRAYAQSESIVRHLVARFGEVGLRGVISEFSRSTDFKGAMIAALGIPLVDLEVSWAKELDSRGPLAVLLVKSIPLFAFVAILVVIGFWRARRRRGRMLARFDAEPTELEEVAETDEAEETDGERER